MKGKFLIVAVKKIDLEDNLKLSFWKTTLIFKSRFELKFPGWVAVNI